MSRKLILLAAIPLLFASPALPQSTDQAPAGSGVETPPPPAASEMPAPDGTAGSAAPSGSAAAPAAGTTDGATPPATTAASGEVQILTEESADQILADDIIGMDVVDTGGKKIGTVDDVVLDKSGQVSGLVLSAGEILGLGGKTVAISWQDVAAADGAASITVNLTEEQLTAAPEFRTEEQQMEEATQAAPPE